MGAYARSPGREDRRRLDTVYFLSDYGLSDEFVGVVKAVVRGLAPHVDVIDLTHQVPPQDVAAGAAALARAAAYLTTGVTLAVVDPGVGTGRRCVAVEVDGDRFLVGPDNGVLYPALVALGGGRRAVSLTSERHHLPTPGPTFAGRDVMAPAAAHLCAGVELSELGEAVDPAGLVSLPAFGRTVEEGRVRCRVSWVDRFGNAQLSADAGDGDSLGRAVVVRAGTTRTPARRVSAFAELGPDEVGLLVDSSGQLAVVVNRASAAARLRLSVGDELVIESR